MESINKLNKEYCSYRLQVGFAAAIYALIKEKCRVSSAFRKCVEKPNKSFTKCIAYVFQIDIETSHDAFKRAIDYYTNEVI